MKVLLSLAGLCFLTACGGSDNGRHDDPVVIVDPPIPYLNLHAPQPSGEVLKVASSETLEQLLKNGVRLEVYTVQSGVVLESAIDRDVLASNADAPAASDNFSTTNVQVVGVDEADYVKYDGQYLYLHAWPDWAEGNVLGHRIRVLETHPQTATANEVAVIPMAENNYSGAFELYLQTGEERADALVSVGSYGGYYWPEQQDVWSSYFVDKQEIELSLFDLDDPAAPERDWVLRLDGRLHASRKIGDMLYLVSSYLPQSLMTEVEPLLTETDTSAVELKLNEVAVEELLPTYTINDGEPQLLHASDECLLGAEESSTAGYRNLHYVTAIDLNEKAVVKTLCLGTPIHGVYSSEDNLYLGVTVYGDNWQDSFTVLHKISLADNTVNYRATGSVPGNLGWDNPSFRMDEHEGFMRVITSAFTDGEPDHRLWVLNENTQEQTLELTGQLPSESQPAPIGHPGEDIYAVRFYGDQAYVVTFERTDPLYVLDLTSSTEPKIAGELELPGFSTYLHPLEEGYVFGFGRDADEDGGQQGLKAALFDVRELDSPKIVDEIVFGGRGSWSDALYDHKAFNFLRTGDDDLRITFPAILSSDSFANGGETDEFTVVANHSRVLVLLEANNLSREDAELRVQGAIQKSEGDERNWYDFSAFGRGILHDDAVYCIDEPEVWGAFWSDPATAFGPF